MTAFRVDLDRLISYFYTRHTINVWALCVCVWGPEVGEQARSTDHTHGAHRPPGHRHAARARHPAPRAPRATARRRAGAGVSLINHSRQKLGAFRAFGHKLYGEGPYMKQNVAN